jgi:hypothetical protein
MKDNHINHPYPNLNLDQHLLNLSYTIIKNVNKYINKNNLLLA